MTEVQPRGGVREWSAHSPKGFAGDVKRRQAEAALIDKGGIIVSAKNKN